MIGLVDVSRWARRAMSRLTDDSLQQLIGVLFPGILPSFSFPTKKAATKTNAITTHSFIMYAARVSSIRVRGAHGELT